MIKGVYIANQIIRIESILLRNTFNTAPESFSFNLQLKNIPETTKKNGTPNRDKYCLIISRIKLLGKRIYKKGMKHAKIIR